MIKLPATPVTVLREVVVPALQLLPTRMDSPEARVLVLAIMMQESDLARRRQLANGPARGLAQFEISGATEVLTRSSTSAVAKAICRQRGVPRPDDPAVLLEMLELDDVLAAACARLLLWVDPASLPRLGDEEGAWRYYLRCWKPGKPRPEHWPGNYSRALAAVSSN